MTFASTRLNTRPSVAMRPVNAIHRESRRGQRPRYLRRIGAVSLGATISLFTVAGYSSGGAEAAEPIASTLVVTAAPSPYASNQANVIALTNRQRVALGRRALAPNAALNTAAQRHANDIAIRGASHTGSDGSNGGQRIRRAGFVWTSWGENVAAGQRTPAQVVSAWMKSPGHRVNMINPTFAFVGVGVAVKNGTYFWVLVFGSR